MNSMKTLVFLITVLFISLLFVHDYYKFVAIKKYYPEMTYIEFSLLNDKLIIIPSGK